MKVKDLERTHPSLDRAHLARCRALYEGGRTLRGQIADLLPAHYLEPADVVAERRQRAAYENHCGPIVDQWVGEVFRCDAAVTPSSPGAMPEWAQGFLKNADRQGTPLLGVARELLREALIGGCGWLLIDMPSVQGEAPTDRSQAASAGLSQPYVVPLKTAEVVDWEEDAQGQLTWVLIRTERSVRGSVEQGRVREIVWTVWTREGWRRYGAVGGGEGAPAAEDEVVLKGEGRHALGCVPVVRLALPGGLWMMELLLEPALALFGLEAALEWSLLKSAFAVPVFQTDQGMGKVRLGPGRFLELEREDKYGWLEPSGTSWAALDQRIQRRLEGIYRIGRQLAQAVSNDATRARSSGESKAQDRKPTEVVLAAYGQRVCEALQAALALAARWMGLPEAPARVTGLDDYDGTDLDAELERALVAQSLRVPSVTLYAQLFKRLAQRLLDDAPEEVRAQVMAEIDAGAQVRAQTEDLYGGPGRGRSAPAHPA